MSELKITGKQLRALGYPQGLVVRAAIDVVTQHYADATAEEVEMILTKVLADPAAYTADAVWVAVATALLPEEGPEKIALRDTPVDYAVFGAGFIEEGAIKQLNNAVRLPVAVAGALMPDAHQGYGLPIGGVLAAENAVIPYGVGVDIGCRMCLSILDLPVDTLVTKDAQYQKALKYQTKFGAGAEWKRNDTDAVLERDEFKEIQILRNLQQKAAGQLGTSGSGNHFVEWGIVSITDINNEWNLVPGDYVALLSHSGSRGLGAQVAGHYTRLAKELCVLPKEAQHLAYLDLSTEAGQEYWLAMNLAGDYASACHHLIHKRLIAEMGATLLARVENHHNFAWKEVHHGKELIVHRKGATPAGKGVLGIIPGSMTAPGFIVRGKGESTSLHSASHGAGRQMSRTKAIASITNDEMRKMLQDNGVTLIGGGLDEAPGAYKDIHTVMAAQSDLVEVVGQFQPKMVRMADGGPAED
ncbi:RtcB family protein [Chitinophaga qingshengii]|uniref:3'-phosphate/5'-hydroxy nucleic acid ligase n=1 Tax=Chitinophaga qingshengii TaxID=1569794 RepID=A0ABR7TVV8_9BACT|nr:RtcB family protein [Chitinophaga qingshengii]MBC9933790.1 RtcB family protein [Chitinophaga qingshengii]